MNTIVLNADEALRARILADFDPYRQTAKNPYLDFFAKVPGASISLYTSGKLVIQGAQAMKIAQKYGVAPSKQVAPLTQEVPYIGTDEVGNGSYFGGLAVVASFVSPSDHGFLRQLGVDDSKRLTDHHIRKIAPQLMERIPHQSLLLAPKKYNEVVGENKAYNAVSVKVALHNQAIYLLLDRGYKPEHIVIDAFTSSKNYKQYVTKEKNQVTQPITLEEKAEGKYLAVAVSSIIARYLFLDNLDHLSSEMGILLPSGAGTKSDQVAAQLIKKQGLAVLNQCAKLHFANTQKALRLASS